jgi:oxygen-independent coproporphyrinogen-3 oxidase
MKENEYTKNWGYLVGIRPVKNATGLMAEGRSDDEIMEYYIDNYKVAPETARLVLMTAKAEKPIIDAANPNGVSLYINIPFCPSRCLYCSFSSQQSVQSKHLIPEYLCALYKEITAALEIIKRNGNVIETMYIGGGTPTVLSAEQLDELLSKVSHIPAKEFTVEAGRPDTITREKLEQMKRHNVTRLSINPQTMNDEILAQVGRKHTSEQTRNAVKLARECGFDNINMDIIAGLPGETFDMFCATVEEVCAMEPENITVHAMCVKRTSDLNEDARRKKNVNRGTVLDDSLNGAEVERMVKHSRETLIGRGFFPYYLYRQKYILGDCENVGYAKAGFEGIYNIHMMAEIQTIMAVGAGSVTKTVDLKTNRIERIFNVKEAIDYINRIDEMIERKLHQFA